MQTIFSTRTFFISAICMAMSGATLVAQERLSLSEAVRRALENNPELSIDAPAREAARQEFKAAKAGYLPHLDFEQSYQAGNNPVFVFSTLLSQQRFTANNFAIPDLNAPSPKNNLQTKITGQQVLWDFGRTRALRNQAQLGIQIADQSHEDHKRQLILEVFQTYYAASLAQSAVESSRRAVQSAEAIEKQAQARVDNGLAVEADLLRSRVYLATVRQQAIQSQGQWESAQAQLNRLMGVPLNQTVGETAPLLPKNIPIPAEEQLLMEQKQRRPDYQNLLLELHQAETSVLSRQKEFLPVATGYGTWEADNPSLRDAGGNNWAAGITLRWNLFSGGSDAAQLAAARQRLEQQRRRKTAMESAMALEIRKTLIQQRSAELEVQAAQAAELQSEEGLRILKNRYEAGLATMTDLLSVEAARSGARTNLANSIYKYRITCAQVEYAAGILGPNSAVMNLQ
jgi:outer membrane protein